MNKTKMNIASTTKRSLIKTAGVGALTFPLLNFGTFQVFAESSTRYSTCTVDLIARSDVVVDVSHCGERTTLDALEVSKRPVLITHGNPKTLNRTHPRTKTEEAIRKMAAGGGVMGIAYLRIFTRDREPTTIEHALDHFDYVARS